MGELDLHVDVKKYLIETIITIEALREVVWVNPSTFRYDDTVRAAAACT